MTDIIIRHSRKVTDIDTSYLSHQASRHLNSVEFNRKVMTLSLGSGDANGLPFFLEDVIDFGIRILIFRYAIVWVINITELTL